MSENRARFLGLGLCGLVALVALQAFDFTSGASWAGEKKKLELPVLPSGFGNPKWDLKVLEERFVVIKGGITDQKQVYFLLELKQDDNALGFYKVHHLDKDGVAFVKENATVIPGAGKKGDRVRLVISNSLVGTQQDVYAKTATIKIVQ